MADHTLNDFNVNQKTLIDLRDKITSLLRQAIALADVAMIDNFLDCNDDVIKDYIWAIQSLICRCS